MHAITDPRHYRDIAAAIRTHLRTSGTIMPSQMAASIAMIPNAVDFFATGASLSGRIVGFTSHITSTLTGHVGITDAEFPNCVDICDSAFFDCPSLAYASFPACEKVGYLAFAVCTSLSEVVMPSCRTVGSRAFAMCSSLSHIDLPSCETLGELAFWMCRSLSAVRIPSCMEIGAGAFSECTTLMEVDLTGVRSVPSLGGQAFLETPIEGNVTHTGSLGSVYVPSSLYDRFLTAPNWSYVRNRIVPA